MIKLTEPGQPCRNCRNPLIKAIPKKRNPKKAYWFEWYLKCTKCGNMYMVESAKIINPDYKRKPDPKWKKDWIKNKESKQELDAGYLRLFTALDKIENAPKLISVDNLKAIARNALNRIIS